MWPGLEPHTTYTRVKRVRYHPNKMDDMGPNHFTLIRRAQRLVTGLARSTFIRCGLCRLRMTKKKVHLFIHRGITYCERCAVDGNRIMNLGGVDRLYGTSCRKLIQADTLAWLGSHRQDDDKQVECGEYLVSVEDLEMVISRSTQNDEVKQSHAKVAEELAEHQALQDRLVGQKRKLNEAMDRRLIDLRAEIITEFKTKLGAPGVNELLVISRDAYHVSKRLRSLADLGIDDKGRAKYYMDLSQAIKRGTDQLREIQYDMDDIRLSPPHVDLKRRKKLWYGLMRRRDLTNCTAMLSDGKRRCNLHTDGSHRYCKRHLAVMARRKTKGKTKTKAKAKAKIVVKV